MSERTKNIVSSDKDELIVLIDQYVKNGYKIVGEIRKGDNSFYQILKYENDIAYKIWNK